jgi:hypothetical protein
MEMGSGPTEWGGYLFFVVELQWRILHEQFRVTQLRIAAAAVVGM